MPRTTARPVVFIGSSTESLLVAEEVRRLVRSSAHVHFWSSAFDPGKWTLRAILDYAQQSDFGVFVMAPDDNSVIRGEKQWIVRDNVLFEAGIFMGALGPERTFLLWPSNIAGRVRLPSDLLGLTTVVYEHAKPLQTAHLAKMLNVIQTMGPALRSGYNEILGLSQLLDEREQFFTDGSSASFKEIIAPVAARRKRPWFSRTPVRILMDGISEGYKDAVVDDIFWWLIVDGIVTFDNIDIWSSDDSWHWDDSVDYAVFTDRGVVLLNQFRSERKLSRV